MALERAIRFLQFLNGRCGHILTGLYTAAFCR
jgi:hypothetical protein